jgi:hypothetical protein
MDKRKQKKIKRGLAAYRKPPSPCPNCGKPGSHFIPPCFGDPGMWACAAFNQLTPKKLLDENRRDYDPETYGLNEGRIRELILPNGFDVDSMGISFE